MTPNAQKDSELIGFAITENEKCCKCQINEDLIQVEVDDEIKKLPVTRIYTLCKKCYIEIGLKLPRELK